MQPTVTFTVFTSDGGSLTKRLSLSEDGSLKKAAPRAAGNGRTAQVTLPFDRFGDFVGGLRKTQCLIHGVTEQIDAQVVPEGKSHPSAINRTKTYFSYPDGNGLVMLDHDPDGVGQYCSPTELLSLLVEILPEAASAAHLVRYSTSSWVYDKGGKLLSSPSPGYHLYFVAQNAADIPRFGRVLFKRLWLAGYGHCRLSKTGSVLERGPIDQSVFSPERCDFVAGAVLSDGLQQRFPSSQYVGGDVIDTELVPNLSDDEEREYQRLVVVERSRLKPQQEQKRRSYAKELAHKKGESEEVVYRRLQSAEHGVIDASTRVRCKSGGEFTLSRLIEAGRHGEYIEDPSEPSDTHARLYIDGPGKAVVRSFLHGGRTLLVKFSPSVSPKYPSQSGTAAEARKQASEMFHRWGDATQAYWREMAAYEASVSDAKD